MRGLKKHTHNDRSEIVAKLIPLLQTHFKENLLAFASSASYARNEDSDYSDLELIVFVKQFESFYKPAIGFIIDGMLTEIYLTTVEQYLAEREIGKNWYIAGSDRLLGIINTELIESINQTAPKDLEMNCRSFAIQQWNDVQEATSKVLNAKDAEAVHVLANDMLMQIMILLSFLNKSPYITLSKFVGQSKKFSLKPESFTLLLQQIEQGCPNLAELQNLSEAVFNELEVLMDAQGLEIYPIKTLEQALEVLTRKPN